MKLNEQLKAVQAKFLMEANKANETTKLIEELIQGLHRDNATLIDWIVDLQAENAAMKAQLTLLAMHPKDEEVKLFSDEIEGAARLSDIEGALSRFLKRRMAE